MYQNELPNGTLLQGSLGTYEVLDAVGRGGFGITYRAAAHGSELPRHVAIKEFFPFEVCSRSTRKDSQEMIIDSPDYIEQVSRMREGFIRESHNLENCDHPNIVKVFETMECNGTAYMVMELIEGKSVKEMMEQYTDEEELMPFEFAEGIIRQAAAALKYLHGRKITHLDVKPANLMLDGRRIVLVDFGSSVQADSHVFDSAKMLTSVSKGYTAPELYKGVSTFSPQSDIYSLGATFYFLLSGEAPPEPAILSRYPQELAFDEDVPGHYRDAVREAMALKAKNRTTTVEGFLKTLDESADEDDTLAMDGTKRKDNRRVARFLLSAVCILLLVADLYRIYLELSGDERTYSMLFEQTSGGMEAWLSLSAATAFAGIAFKPVTVKTICAVFSATVTLILTLNSL